MLTMPAQSLTPSALYEQVAELLRQRIYNRELAPGSWIDELKALVDLVMIHIERNSRLARAINDAGNSASATQAAARTRSLHITLGSIKFKVHDLLQKWDNPRPGSPVK